MLSTVHGHYYPPTRCLPDTSHDDRHANDAGGCPRPLTYHPATTICEGTFTYLVTAHAQT